VRKVWLRTRDERVPEGFVREPFDFPFKLRPLLLQKRRDFRYRPQNLNYVYDTLEFVTDGPGGSSTEVREEVREVHSAIAERVVPWASSLPVKALLNGLKKNGEGAWIERLWIEDCMRRPETAVQ
jgi:hypothetical protein